MSEDTTTAVSTHRESAEVVVSEPGIVADIVNSLAGDASWDDLEWLRQARHAGCHLPAELRAALRELRHDSPRSGFLHISGLPIDDAELPATPQVRDSAGLSWTPWSAMLLLVALQLGDVVGYRDEKNGALVHDVVPVPGMENTQSNAGSVQLTLHVENAFHAFRPDYVALMCLRSGHDGAGTLVASLRWVLDRLSDRDRAVLGESRFRTDPPPSFTGASIADARHAILQGHPDDPTLVYDVNATAAVDPEGAAAMESLRRLLVAGARRVALQPGELVLLDNHVAVHGRDAFVPRYDGFDRWLQRCYIRHSGRHSAPMRQSIDPVLV